MYRVYLGLGSNEGDKLATLAAAVREIGERMPVFALSSIYETEPVDMPGVEWFFNMVIGVETGLAPVQLLYELHHLEDSLGRKPSTHMKPRPIDIDILIYEGLTYTDSIVHVPHRAMHRRRFVLAPLQEIAPTLVHPTLQRTITELLEECSDKSEVYRTSLRLPDHQHIKR